MLSATLLSRTKVAAPAAVVAVSAIAAALIASSGGSSAAAAARYQTVPVSRTTVADVIDTTGTVTPDATLELAFGSAAGSVTAVDVRPGQTVSQGQLLATADSSAAQSQLAAAEAQVAAAQAEQNQPTTSQSSFGSASGGSGGGGPARFSTGGAACQPGTMPAPSGSSQPAPQPGWPHRSPSPVPSPAPSSPWSGSPSPSPTPTPSASSTPTPSVAPSPSPSATPTPSPSATSDSTGTQTTPQNSAAATPTAAGTASPAPSGSTSTHPAAYSSGSFSGSSGTGTRTMPVCGEPSFSGHASGGGRTGAAVGPTGGSGAQSRDQEPSTGTSLTDAQQQLEAAQAAVGGTRIVAPESGVITAVNLTVGTMPASPAIELRTSTLSVQVDVQEQDAPYVAAGQPVQLSFPALGVSTTGSVAAPPIQPDGSGGGASGSGTVVTFPVDVSITDPPPGLLPGMSAEATWTAATHANVLAVPTSAVHGGDSGDVVSVLVHGQPVTQPVSIGLSTSDLTEVTSGLQAGEAVVIGLSSG